MANRVKEDEKNEKIIRGLMKLQANRRCINCNNLGPQYVCTNFSTFICTNCSGVHREFTHRVKSVSMAKFTSLEVAALQEGGNERARETFFKEWETQRNQFPDSSNIDKLRDFIKHVYEERRFTGEKRAPRPKPYNEEPSSETRRPESYRGGSRSPPYTERYIESPYSSRGSNDGRNPRNSYGDRSPPDYTNDGRNSRSSYGDRSPPDYRRSPQQRPLPESSTKPAGGSPNYQRDNSAASSPQSVSVRPVRDILGPDAPALRVGEIPPPKVIARVGEIPPPKVNGGTGTRPPSVPISPISPPPPQAERTSSASSTPSARADPVQPTIQPPVQPSVQPTPTPAPQPDILSLIDFSSDPDPPTPAQQPPSSNPNSESGGWAAFDAFGGQQPASNPNPNSVMQQNSQVDLGLEQLSLSGPSPAKPADVSPSSVEASLFDAIAAAPSIQQQNVTQPTNPSNLNPPQENAAAMETKPSGRKELPQDFFSSLYPAATPQMAGWQRAPQYMGYAMQYPAGMVMPTYPQQVQPQPVKSANPFDIADPAPAQQAPTYPTMTPANMMNIPNMNMHPNMNVGPQQGTSPRWMVPQQMHPHPSQYMMQQMQGNIPQQMPNNMFPIMQQGGLSQVNTGFTDPNIQNRYSQPNTPNNSFGTVGGTNPFG